MYSTSYRVGVCNIEQARVTCRLTNESPEFSVYSILADLMFYCDEYKIDFEAAKKRAETFFQRQTGGDECPDANISTSETPSTPD